MEKVRIVNMKCGGCVATVEKGLKELGMKKVKVDLKKSTVEFEGNRKLAVMRLSKLGYPEEGSEEAMSMMKKMRSYVSCAVGKIDK